MNPNRTASNGKPVTVTLFGTGDAFASFGRSQSGYLIDAPGGRILMEAGPGLMQALKSNGVSTDSFDLLLISHLHGDYFARTAVSDPRLHVGDAAQKGADDRGPVQARGAHVAADAHDVPAFRAQRRSGTS